MNSYDASQLLIKLYIGKILIRKEDRKEFYIKGTVIEGDITNGFYLNVYYSIGREIELNKTSELKEVTLHFSGPFELDELYEIRTLLQHSKERTLEKSVGTFDINNNCPFVDLDAENKVGNILENIKELKKNRALLPEISKGVLLKVIDEQFYINIVKPQLQKTKLKKYCDLNTIYEVNRRRVENKNKNILKLELKPITKKGIKKSKSLIFKINDDNFYGCFKMVISKDLNITKKGEKDTKMNNKIKTDVVQLEIAEIKKNVKRISDDKNSNTLFYIKAENEEKKEKVAKNIEFKKVNLYGIPAEAKIIDIGHGRIKVILKIYFCVYEEIRKLRLSHAVRSNKTYMAYSTCDKEDVYDYEKGSEIAIRKAYKKFIEPLYKAISKRRNFIKTNLDGLKETVQTVNDEFININNCCNKYQNSLDVLDKEIEIIDEEGIEKVSLNLLETKIIDPNTGEVIVKKLNKEQYDKLMSILE